MKSLEKLRIVLLVNGILGSILYVGADLLAGKLYDGYSFTSQAISELFAIGAPTSGLVVPIFTLCSILQIAFALGVWASANRIRALSVAALMMVGNALNGLVLWNIFPMHVRGVEATFTDTMHVLLSGTGAIFAILALGFGTFAFKNRFRTYSVAMIFVLLAPGLVAFMYIPQVAALQPTPWVGLTERISTYSYLLWQATLAFVLIKARAPQPIKKL